MPGLVGITRRDMSSAQASAVVFRMQDLLVQNASTYKDQVFCDEDVCATRAHSNIIQKQSQPYAEDGIYVWLDGEFFNREGLAGTACSDKGSGMSDPQALLALFKRHKDFKFLKDIDGIYSSVIYDSRNHRIHLISDRYGLRHLFWTINDGHLAWASELKCMLGLVNFQPKIDPIALEDFLKVGHMLGNRTWFDGVHLLPAATVLTWETGKQAVLHKRYWWWDQIKPLSGNFNEVEILEELADLFVAGVKRRCNETEDVGLTLSGGLDSRAILAAMPCSGKTIHAATFGKVGCDDIVLAAAACQVKGAAHHIAEINAQNWLQPRIDGVWWTDGQLDLMHMHVIAVRPMVRSLFKVSLDGFLGDAVIGGSYLGSKSQMIEKIDNRGRRFIILGPRVLIGEVESRFPFFDNRFLEMVISLPEGLLAEARVYRKMLIRRFPEFFSKIPWQKTGAPIEWPHFGEGLEKGILALKDKVVNKTNAFGLLRRTNRGYADYANWVRQDPARTVFQDILGNPSALYAEFIPRGGVVSDLARHFNGHDCSELLGRILTFEIWLQQVFEGRLRPLR